MVKYFCDECGIEVDKNFALFVYNLTGKILCLKHKEKYDKFMKEHSAYFISVTEINHHLPKGKREKIFKI